MAFERILLLDGGNGQRGDLYGFGAIRVNDFTAVLSFGTLTDGKAVGPLAVNCVERIFLLAGRVKSCGEAIFLTGEPAFAGIIYFSDITRGRGDVGALVQFNERISIDEAFDVEGREGDEVGFLIGG